jgi:threonine dehydratase
MTKIETGAISDAERRIRPYIRRTPVVETGADDFGLRDDVTLVFKLELCQHTGSFKPRGAFTHLVGREIPRAGVVAASGGNHGVAVAYAAHKLGIPARIFVPQVAAPSKLEKIRAFGAELTIVGERYADALAASEIFREESGALALHAYDQLETLIGQGTLGLEFDQQADRLDSLLVAVGGGGLLGGVASWFAERIESGRIKVIGVEPEKAPTLTDALKAGGPVDAPADGIAADSLAPRRVGELMFPIAKRLVSDVLLVSDDAIRAAQEALWSTLRVAAEPGGAAAFAALFSLRYVPRAGERVGVVVCGGNK